MIENRMRKGGCNVKSVFLGILIAGLSMSAAQAKDVMELVIEGGPFAGTQRLEPGPNKVMLCGVFPGSGQLSVVWKDMKSAMSGAPPNQLTSVGFNIANPKDAGRKAGGIVVTFGGKSPTYEILVPSDSKGPLNLSRQGQQLSVSFDGTTTDGIPIKVSATCTED
jgi:hypothetical protein